MSWLSEAWHRTAPPRDDADAAFMARYQRISRPLIVAAALLPLVITAGRGTWLGIIVGVGSWLVFVLDFVIQTRRRVHYLKSRVGMFDFLVVVLTSPWYLIPGVHGGAVVTLLRLARLFRVLVVFKGAKRLAERLGKAFIVAILVTLLFSYIAFDAERAVNGEFATFGDAVWWGVVTLTTVGYGDIVPITLTGRIAGVAIMVAGLALLGVVSGSLASFFKLSPQQESKDEAERKRFATELADDPETGEPKPGADGHIPEPPAVPVPPKEPAGADDLRALTQQVIDLRDELHQLAGRLGHREHREHHEHHEHGGHGGTAGAKPPESGQSGQSGQSPDSGT